MTEKLPPLPQQFQGQDATTVFRGAYWISPDRVREYIAGAKREPLVALTDDQISALWGCGLNTVVGFTRAGIAEFCRINGLPAPKP